MSAVRIWTGNYLSVCKALISLRCVNNVQVNSRCCFGSPRERSPPSKWSPVNYQQVLKAMLCPDAPENSSWKIVKKLVAILWLVSLSYCLNSTESDWRNSNTSVANNITVKMCRCYLNNTNHKVFWHSYESFLSTVMLFIYFFIFF